MFHVCATRFDVTGNLENSFGFQGKLNKALIMAMFSTGNGNETRTKT